VCVCVHSVYMHEMNKLALLFTYTHRPKKHLSSLRQYCNSQVWSSLTLLRTGRLLYETAHT